VILLHHVGVVGSALVPKRTASLFGRAIAGILLGLALVVGLASPASAHNSFVRSDPADGAQLSAAPTQLALTFAKDVVLDQLQVEFTDAAGVRSPLSGFTLAPSGPTTALVPMPSAATGAVSLRWKLVGSDGHTVSGRVGLAITPAPVVTTAAPDPAAEASATSTVAPLSTATSVEATSSAASESSSSSSSSALGTLLRWLLRFAAFVGLVALGGSIVTSALLWQNAWSSRVVRQIAAWGTGLVIGSTVISLMMFYADVGSVKVLLNTSYGLALAVRVILMPVVAVYLFTWFPNDEIKRWSWLGGGLAVVAATWSWSGHARSLRWPIVGVPLDAVHLVAASAWIGGLVCMGWVVLRLTTNEEQVSAVKAFAPVASRSVAAIVVTGVLQTFRIDGSPVALFTSTHGRLVLVKIVVLALMLYVANVNRTRVATRFRTNQPSRAVRTMLQRAIVTEAVVGLSIIAVTAVLVVNSPPPG
jgi:copper transport protein